MKWYMKNNKEIIQTLKTDIEKGLSQSQVDSRLDKYGPNSLKEEKSASLFSKILAQFADFLVLILIAAAIISAFVGEKTDALVILAIVVLNALLGVYQEGKAEKSLDALKKMSSPTAKIIRNGQTSTVDADSLVPGDIILLDAGDIIPADLRFIESSNLKVEEASLTGESVPVEKYSDEEYTEEVSLGDRKNMGYMSTIVSYGRAKSVVVATGADTEIGKIATAIQTTDTETTPLQRQLNGVGRILGLATIVICVLVFAVGLLQGKGLLEMLLISISLAVAAIPEGLPAIVTIVLAVGMNNMVKKNAIVKKLLAVETLGSTTVICSDKTGTLTQNEMTVVKIYTNDNIIDVSGTGYSSSGNFNLKGEKIEAKSIPDLNTLLSIATLTNDADIEKTEDGYKVIGDPTEGSLISLAGKANILKNKINKKYPRIEEIPFDSKRKMMTTFHKDFIEGKIVSFTKGAPDIIIDKCSYISLNGKPVEFNDNLKKRTMEINKQFSKDALRVLAFAYKEYPNLPININQEEVENNMTFVGLVGMIDPARPEAKEAIKKCKKAGIRTMMITGDYKETAFAIAKELGIAEKESETIMGSEIDILNDEELQERVKTTKVFSRVSPNHKVRIVDALKRNGNTTAMTGDGVNDAPALKKADIGIAMGITGTDVAKNTAELILTDDNFSTIVSAVEEGRIIYDNIRKFVYFLLSCNIGEILLIFISILAGLEIPLLPIQLLWLNLITDSFPALALGVEQGDPDIMEKNPRNPKEALLNKDLIARITVQSIAIGGTTLAAYMLALKAYPNNIIETRTIVFTTLILAELLRSYSVRSETHTIFEIGIFSNMTLVYATLFSLTLTLAVVYIPFLQPIFHTFPLGLADWKIILPFAFIPLFIGELSKLVRRVLNK